MPTISHHQHHILTSSLISTSSKLASLGQAACSETASIGENLPNGFPPKAAIRNRIIMILFYRSHTTTFGRGIREKGKSPHLQLLAHFPRTERKKKMG